MYNNKKFLTDDNNNNKNRPNNNEKYPFVLYRGEIQQNVSLIYRRTDA